MSNSSIGTDDSLQELNDCGCCEGRDRVTPAIVKNRPGLSAITYRVGTHSQFKESMLAALSDAGRPILGNLKTREDDDFSIALIDAWAVVADVLTFYQERIINESYLPTATERRSVIELVRAIGYRLNPGVAASTYLAFTLEDAQGSPKQATINPGTKVQSIPDPGEKPQTYETVEKLAAKVSYNLLKPRQTQLQLPGFGSRHVYLEGITNNLKAGDRLLFIGIERAVEEGAKSERWDFRAISSVKVEIAANRTLVQWLEPLGSLIPYVEPAKRDLKIYVMRLHASLFGYNAPDWHALPVALRVGEVNPDPSSKSPFLPGVYANRENNWADANFSATTKTINLDVVYNQIVRNSWIVLTKPLEKTSFKITKKTLERLKKEGLPAETLKGLERLKDKEIKEENEFFTMLERDIGKEQIAKFRSLIIRQTEIPAYVELYRVTLVEEEAKVDFNISAKTTRLTISGENIDKFSPRSTSVYAQNEELTIAQTPLVEPVYGKEIILDSVVDDLEADKRMIIRGKRPRVEIDERAFNLQFVTAENMLIRTVKPGDIFFLISLPTLIDDRSKVSAGVSARINESKKIKRWHLLDQTGKTGFLIGSDSELIVINAEDNDQSFSELVTLKEAVRFDEYHTKLIFKEALKNIYDRASTVLYANVALATHGESASDVLGSGNGSLAYQQFTLKRSPLTYTSTDTPSGGESTLEVWVNGLKWKEVVAFFGHGAREQIYTTQIDDNGVTTIEFGDGITGSRLPTGQENVRANYRIGLGRAGLVKADQLSLLMTRPLGVKAVTNPIAPSGAQDPQSLSNARNNAPITVLTLDRIVSLQDYEDFARSYTGIAKAFATETWQRHTRGIFVTVAAPFGNEVPDDSELSNHLLSAMQKAGDARVPVKIKSYHKVFFKIAAQLRVDPAYLSDHVLANVKSALRSNFSFDARAFAQPVTLSEVIMVIQTVKGVISVDVNRLYRSDGAEMLETYLLAKGPQIDNGSDRTIAIGAELLTLDPGPLDKLEIIV